MILEIDELRRYFWNFFDSFDNLGIDIRTIEELKPKAKKFVMDKGKVYYSSVPNFQLLVEKYFHYFGEIETVMRGSNCIETLRILGIETTVRDLILTTVIRILDLSYMFQETIHPSFLRKDSDLQNVEIYFHSDTNSIIEGLFKLISKPFIIINVLFVLTNVILQTPIRISERILIRVLSDIEQNILIDNQLKTYKNYTDRGYTYVVEKKYRVNYETDRDKLFNDMTNTKNKILTSIRLVSGTPNCDLSLIQTNYGLVFPYRVEEFLKVDSESSVIEGKDLKEVYGWLDNVESSRSLTTAIERFNSGLLRSSISDKMVDYSISFESLFTNPIGEGKENIGYKLKTRVSRLLIREFKERVEVGEIMKKFYDGRSNIVHSNNMDNRVYDINLKCQNLLRESIRMYLEGLFHFNKRKNFKFQNKTYNDFHQFFLDYIDFESQNVSILKSLTN